MSNKEKIYKLLESKDPSSIQLAWQLDEAFDYGIKKEIEEDFSSLYYSLTCSLDSVLLAETLSIEYDNGKMPTKSRFLQQVKCLEIYCGTKTIPNFVFELKNLEYLDLSEIGLIQVSEKIGQLKNLEHLYLYNNHLHTLPDSIFKLRNLKQINIEMNQFKDSEISRIKKNLPNCHVESNGQYTYRGTINTKTPSEE